jgi:hypothetical protein
MGGGAAHSYASIAPTREQYSADAIDAILAEGESANTVRSYQGALRYGSAWFSLRYGRAIALPVPTPVALQFIVGHVERTTENGLRSELPAAIDAALVDAGLKGKLGSLAMATVSHRLSVLSKVHQIKALPNPCRDPQVQELLSKARRAYAKRGVTQDKKPALTREPLEAMLATCDDSLRGNPRPRPPSLRLVKRRPPAFRGHFCNSRELGQGR